MFLVSKQNGYSAIVNQIKKAGKLMTVYDGMETGKYFVSQTRQKLMYHTQFLLVCYPSNGIF
jgi:hypothetical protein